MTNKMTPTRTYIEDTLVNGLVNEAENKHKPPKDCNFVDLSDIMHLHGDEYIEALYLGVLERNADTEGINYFHGLMAQGAKNEALAYIICTSAEFADRATVHNIEKYEKSFLRFNSRKKIKHNSYLRWFWDLLKIPQRVREERILLEQLSAILEPNKKNKIDNRLLFGADKVENIEQRLLGVEQSISSDEGVKQKLSELELKIDRLQTANNNLEERLLRLMTINCEKIDAQAKLTLDLSVKSKTAFSVNPGGVTALIVSDFIMGVPSEEWRLAMFLSLYGHFEPGTEKFFASMLEKGMNFIDVGANLGIYSLIAGRAGCNVYAYEPTPQIFDLLKENFSANGFDVLGNVHAYNLAVADCEKKAPFTIFKGLSGHNNMFDPSEDRIEVEAVALDHHIKIERVDVVKIDVEGAEYYVLKGMEDIINNNPDIKIVMEFAPGFITKAGITPMDFIQTIRGFGLEIALIDDEKGTLSRIEDDTLISVYSENVLLTRPHIMKTFLSGE